MPSDDPVGSSKRVPSARIGNGSEIPSSPVYGLPRRNVWPKFVLLVLVVVELKPGLFWLKSAAFRVS